MGKEILTPREKPIVIIIDGVDCSGKSYLVQALSKKYPGIIIKLTHRPRTGDKDETEHYKRHIYSILEYINTNHRNQIIILDRFFPSELAYSKVKREYETFGDKTYIRAEKVLINVPHLFIYCDPGYSTVIDRLKSRGDDYIIESDVKHLMKRYLCFFRQTKLNKLRLDTSKPIGELLEIIKNKIQ